MLWFIVASIVLSIPVVSGFIISPPPYIRPLPALRAAELHHEVTFAVLQSLPCIVSGAYVLLNGSLRDRRSDAMVLCFLMSVLFCVAFFTGFNFHHNVVATPTTTSPFPNSLPMIILAKLYSP